VKAEELVTLACTKETFRPCHSDCVKWWAWSEWPEYFRMSSGMWPGRTPFSKEEWEQARSEGYTYSAAIVNDRTVATAAVWRRSDEEWEVAAVGTAPAFRRQGYGKAAVSFVTDYILKSGRTATIGFRKDNVAMHKTAESVGFCPRDSLRAKQ